jgi:hypothetical protein
MYKYQTVAGHISYIARAVDYSVTSNKQQPQIRKELKSC